jgi:hypothetical protein
MKIRLPGWAIGLMIGVPLTMSLSMLSQHFQQIECRGPIYTPGNARGFIE